ncbi:hypothetical protein E2C01_000479 [Portunus trituberculatus]|uniref:Uncharacterized protein n=1 Tax=Portunus trituberculatus TaxID=210409 RepID=A0A5B7CGP4_PORTR|nr:hypothetical protein [Portunus trituberculatus]
MQLAVCGVVVMVGALRLTLFLALPSRGACRPYLHAPRAWSDAPNTQDVFDAGFSSHTTHNAPTFPYKYEIPVISKRKLKADMNYPCGVNLSSLQPRRDLYQWNDVTVTPVPLLPGQQRCVQALV